MELEKRKYKKAEVDELIAQATSESLTTIATQKENIMQLKEQLDGAIKKLNEYENQEREISSAIVSAEKKAQELERQANERYKLVCDKLRAFSKKWDRYFEELTEKYPLYPFVNNSDELRKQINLLLDREDGAKVIEEIDGKLDKLTKENVKFNPQQKINEYIAATGDNNGFDLQQVLNPGELKLEDLCKELGLMEENE